MSAHWRVMYQTSNGRQLISLKNYWFQSPMKPFVSRHPWNQTLCLLKRDVCLWKVKNAVLVCGCDHCPLIGVHWCLLFEVKVMGTPHCSFWNNFCCFLLFFLLFFKFIIIFFFMLSKEF